MKRQHSLYRVGILFIAVLLFISFVVPHGSYAQDGGELTPEQMEALDRLVEALNNARSYESYVTAFTRTTEQSFVITQGENSFENTETVSAISERRFIRQGEDEANIQGTLILTKETVENGETTSVLLSGEVRRVDGVVYAKVTSLDFSTPTPEGWTVLADEEQAEELFPDLDFEDYFDFADDDEEFAENVDILRRNVLSVEVLTLLDENGEEQEIFTLNLKGAYLQELIAAEEDDEGASEALVAVVYENAEVSLSVYINAAGYITLTNIAFSTTVEDIDLFSADPERFGEGTMMDFSLNFNQFNANTEINAKFDPAVAPDEE